MILLPPPNDKNYVFNCIGWFVCFSVSNITWKRVNRFPCNFQDMFGNILETIWNVKGVLCSTPWMQGFFFLFFLRKPVSVSNIAGKRIVSNIMGSG